MEELDRRLRDAASRGDVETIAALVAVCGDPNARNTPLHLAAHAENAGAVRVLVKAEADRGCCFSE